MSQPSQPPYPALITIPQPPSNPDTPSDMPGTPTSTTTSLSALSTTAIKDGHRGHPANTAGTRGHQSQASTNSLEAERADRISRLAGLSNLTALRGGPLAANAQTTPATGQLAQTPPAAPAYFDANGQPVASTKMSTVGTASATSSGDGRTLGDGADREMDDVDVEDEDVRSMDTNFRTNDSASVGGGLSNIGGIVGGRAGARAETQLDPMDEELATQSLGGFDDRMSDDGNASLVGFGEGAGSTVSGPIYQRRPVPGTSSAGAMAFARWQLERTGSGISEVSSPGGFGPGSTTATAGSSGSTTTGPVGRKDVDLPRQPAALAADGGGFVDQGCRDPNDDDYMDTTAEDPVPLSKIFRDQQQQHQHGSLSDRSRNPGQPSSLEAAERMVAPLENGESAAVDGTVLQNTGPSKERLGQFCFEK